MRNNPSKAERHARGMSTTVAKASIQAQRRAAVAGRLAENERASKQIALVPRLDILESGHA
jgi:hypothetical protein